MSEAEEPPPLSAEDELISRAFKAAAYGLVLLPLQLYSLWLLFKLVISRPQLNPDQKKQAWAALVVNFPIFAVSCIVVWIVVTSMQ